MLRHLLRRNETKIVFLIMDGLGDIRTRDFPKTALEAARKPNLDALAREGLCGRSLPISCGVTPGSGPAHFALFGYDPLATRERRRPRRARGARHGLRARQDDVAIRGNFATVDAQGLLTDRRAGRIPHEECIRSARSSRSGSGKSTASKIAIMPVREYRFGVVLSGIRLSPEVEETDPQLTGKAPLAPVARTGEAKRTAEIIAKLVDRCDAILAGEKKANAVLMRGISRKPAIETLQERTMLRPAAIAAYPLYRGVAKLCGMDLIDTGFSIKEEFEALRSAYGARTTTSSSSTSRRPTRSARTETSRER